MPDFAHAKSISMSDNPPKKITQDTRCPDCYTTHPSSLTEWGVLRGPIWLRWFSRHSSQALSGTVTEKAVDSDSHGCATMVGERWWVTECKCGATLTTGIRSGVSSTPGVSSRAARKWSRTVRGICSARRASSVSSSTDSSWAAASSSAYCSRFQSRSQVARSAFGAIACCTGQRARQRVRHSLAPPQAGSLFFVYPFPDLFSDARSPDPHAERKQRCQKQHHTQTDHHDAGKDDHFVASVRFPVGSIG